MLAIIAFFILLVVVVLILNSKPSLQDENINNSTNMQISSPAFNNNEMIPDKYTCDGENVNPPLLFNGIPINAQSLILIMDDPDIPDFVKQNMGIEVFDHWLVYNIPTTTKEIKENSTPPGTVGANSKGENNYTGPCPPDGQHRYLFKLYALDKILDLPEGSNKKQVESAMQGHIISQAELIGLYAR